MAWNKFPITVAAVSASLFLEVFVVPVFSTPKQGDYSQQIPQQNTVNSWEISQIFRSPRNRGLPPAAAGAGTRSGSCVATTEKKLTALIPKNNSANEGQFGLTVSDRPTFFAYIPKTTAQNGELLILENVKDKNDRAILRKSFAIPPRPGIVGITLPSNSQSLEVGKRYKWRIRIVCNPDDRSQDVQSEVAWLERIQPSQTLVDRIKNATPINLSSIYAEEGIWHEAFGSLVKARREQPNNTTLMANWEQMLKSVGLEQFIQEPLIDCCQVQG